MLGALTVAFGNAWDVLFACLDSMAVITQNSKIAQTVIAAHSGRDLVVVLNASGKKFGTATLAIPAAALERRKFGLFRELKSGAHPTISASLIQVR